MTYRFRKEEIARLEGVRQYLAENLHAVIHVPDLCALAAMNRHKLNRGFRMLYGKDATAYQLALRMEKAQRLLRETDQPIEDIAHATGYSHASNLTRAYKRYWGVTAGSERRME